ncbi:hypothetical protein P8452_50179 [Trifolium repens]|nr:hypothetical protein P8452_50179 [Trifolium repens]
MSVVSNSVENEKDFAPPTKKLKVDKDDLVGEEHKTDSVTSLSDRDVFDMWCKFFRVTYKDEEEELYRFGIFQKAIKLDKTEHSHTVRNSFREEELKGCCYAYISKSILDEMMQYAAYLARCNAPDDDDECPEILIW